MKKIPAPITVINSAGLTIRKGRRDSPVKIRKMKAGDIDQLLNQFQELLEKDSRQWSQGNYEALKAIYDRLSAIENMNEEQSQQFNALADLF